MPTKAELECLDKILLAYTHGDKLAVEGMKLSYMALVESKVKFRELNTIQQTLYLVNAKQVEEQFRKLDKDIEDLTKMIFTKHGQMAWELVREEYRCQPQ